MPNVSVSPATECRCRRPGIFGMLFRGVLVYLALVFVSGTLMNVGNPVVHEFGALVHTVTFVEPLTLWLDAHDFHRIAGGLQVVSNGVPSGWLPV
ncbi:MAG: hypothetical protein KDA25_03150 [Phycisphaerales bacterium]|nr:hypothetical protein [Phycisphaerales bacterium]